MEAYLKRAHMEETSENKIIASKDSAGSVSLRQLLKYADSLDKWLVGLGTLGAIMDGLYMPALLIILSKLLNVLGPGGLSSDSISEIDKYSLYILYVAIVTWFAAFLEGFCWTRTGERQTSRLRRKYLKAVLRQDVGFFDTFGTTTSEVVTSVSNDTLVIQDVLSEKIPNFIMNISFFMGGYCAAFYVAWRLAIVAFPFVILLIIPGIMFGRFLVGIVQKMSKAYSIATDVAEQALSSIRTVYSFVGEERIIQKFGEALDGTVKLGLKQGLVKGVSVGSTGVVFFMWAFMSWYGSRLIMYHGGNGGRIFASGASLITGGLALGTALPNLRYFSEACAAAHRIFEMIDRVPLIDSDETKGVIMEEVFGQIEFRNVKFAYPSRPETIILENFCLTIPASRTVALVGGSGSGKSTAVALLQRFYDPLCGEILLDGVDTRALQLKWLRSQIGLVSQEPALFATSIKENILFGNEGATMDRVIAAARAANAHKFITQLPHGYDTQVGERGVQMSGGQKQRIAIARAMVRDPKILLLDEATSALDAESEKIVQGALDNASIGRTTLIIAHRLSTIRNADLIAVVQNGHVIETGTHQHLIAIQHGAYATLVQLQQAATHEEESGCDFKDSSTVISRSSSLRSRSSSTLSVSGYLDRDKENVTSAIPSFHRLVLLNASEWKQAVLGCFGAVGFGAVQPTHSAILGSMISVYFLQDHKEMKSKIEEYALIFFGLGVFCLLINVVQHYSFAAMGEYLTKRVRERMLSKVLTFEVGWFDQEENSSAVICSRLAKDANVIRSLVGDRTSLLAQSLSAVVIAFTLGLILAWRLAIVMIAIQPLIIICFYAKKTLLQTMSGKAVKAQGQGSQVASEAVGNHRTITAFCSQDKILRLFQNAQQGPHKEAMKQSWYAGLALGTSQFFTVCSTALVFWYGGHLVYKGQITFKAFFKTYLILMSTGRVIAEAGSMTSDIAKGSDAVKSVFDILNRESRINPDDENGDKPHKIEGNINIQNVDFAYPARPDVMVFKDFSLNIKAGSTIALVGDSGSGKSTIIGLIERFYDPLKGMVRIDGMDIRAFNLRFLRRHIALVGQEPTLFAGSIRDNICYGKENATESEMIEAAKAANAHDFISCLRDGYDTNCGDRGVQLSGGQKQRVAIARAVIKNPSILLLDEATSALDSQSEKVVQAALDRVMVGRSCVIIAHRLSTIQNAHTIAVIRDGSVVEQGSHSHLMNKGESSLYFSLARIQQYIDNI